MYVDFAMTNFNDMLPGHLWMFYVKENEYPLAEKNNLIYSFATKNPRNGMYILS